MMDPAVNGAEEGGERYGVEAWIEGTRGTRVRMRVQPPTPTPTTMPPGAAPPEVQPPRQEHDYTASLVAEYGTTLNPYLGTPTPSTGNTPAQSQRSNSQETSAAGAGNSNVNVNAGVNASTERVPSVRFMDQEQERMALLPQRSPSKRVGRKLSKRRRPSVPVPVSG